MIYLDNAATSFPKPACVAEAMASALAQSGANPGRAGHGLALAAGRIVEDCREALAELLGGAVGATRSAVDAGYIGYAHQIGQTGVTVRPRLYIVFGASGAIQHTVGMSAAKTVIAVNRDRLAPIFRCADYGVAADWEETADVMVSTLSKQA